MNKNILIFGLGKQGRKYVSYFYAAGFRVDGVSLSGENRLGLLGLTSIFSFEKVLNQEVDIFQYTEIIIAVSPDSQQQRVIHILLERGYKNKVLIEKPVSYNLQLLEKFTKEDNYYFFIDELILFSSYEHILKYSKIDSFIVRVFEEKYDYYSHILEHVYAGFLLSHNFKDILDTVKIIFTDKPLQNDDCRYDIIINHKYIISYNRGELTLNKKYFTCVNFAKSYEYIIGLNDMQNLLYKKNFKILRRYLNSLGGN